MFVLAQLLPVGARAVDPRAGPGPVACARVAEIGTLAVLTLPAGHLPGRCVPVPRVGYGGVVGASWSGPRRRWPRAIHAPHPPVPGRPVDGDARVCWSAFLSVDLVLGGPLQFNTVFGYTPTVAGRFNGMGNPAFSMLTASGIILAALIAHRIGGPTGQPGSAIAVLGWCVVLDGAPFLGADVGGALTLVPSAGVTAWMLLGLAHQGPHRGARRAGHRRRGRWRSASTTWVARRHAGRTWVVCFADIGDNGFEAFQTVVLRKLNANLSVLTSSVWTLMLPLVFAFVAFLFWRAPWRLRTIRERIPQERAAVAGLITAMVLGFALNDSGISVPGMMLGVVNASLINLLLRVDDDLPSSAADAAARRRRRNRRGPDGRMWRPKVSRRRRSRRARRAPSPSPTSATGS